jgi:hypothetical protein
MGGNPVDNKAVDVLAAAAGVPTPAQARRTWATVWRYRKLALVLGGVGLAAAGGGYGYKYVNTTPGKANAQPPAVTAPKDEESRPGREESTFGDLPPVQPVKAAPTAPEVPAIPNIDSPIDIKVPAPTADKADTLPAPILPPLVTPPAVKRPTGGDDDPPDIAPPPIPEIKLPAGDKKKPATDDGDTFKATGPVPTDKKPAALPTDVTDKKKPATDAPVLPAQGTDVPKVEVPAAPRIEVPATDKKDVPAVPMIPNTDIAPPPPPGPMKMGDAPVVVPAPVNDDKIPTITAPTITVPGPKPDVPPVTIDPMKDLPPLPMGDPPTIKPPVSADPPAVSVPTIDVKLGPAPGAGAEKRDSYNEDWHAWKDGDTMALISQEYYHDAKYAAALDAYNKDHRKPGDKYVRVPDLWKLEELFPNLIKGDKTDRPDPPSRPRTPEARTTGNDGPRFEPVAPLSSGRPAPPASTSRATDEYRVTREAGETIREVAQKVLRDGNGWKKLYELNPGIDPTLPLPAGTIVRLPK